MIIEILTFIVELFLLILFIVACVNIIQIKKLLKKDGFGARYFCKECGHLTEGKTHKCPKCNSVNISKS